MKLSEEKYSEVLEEALEATFQELDTLLPERRGRDIWMDPSKFLLINALLDELRTFCLEEYRSLDRHGKQNEQARLKRKIAQWGALLLNSVEMRASEDATV